jgi:hypothetical protein
MRRLAALLGQRFLESAKLEKPIGMNLKSLGFDI